MTPRILLLSFVACALVISLAAMLAWRGCGDGGRQQQHDAFTEELSAITQAYSRDWDSAREQARSDEERLEARRRWRRAYHADVRGCCARHGRAAPAWARDDDSREGGGE